MVLLMWSASWLSYVQPRTCSCTSFVIDLDLSSAIAPYKHSKPRVAVFYSIAVNANAISIAWTNYDLAKAKL
jgi:hypothetical protein